MSGVLSFWSEGKVIFDRVRARCSNCLEMEMAMRGMLVMK
jgi:hypothetical protein